MFDNMTASGGGVGLYSRRLEAREVDDTMRSVVGRKKDEEGMGRDMILPIHATLISHFEESRGSIASPEDDQ